MADLHKSEISLYAFVTLKLFTFNGQIVTSVTIKRYQNQIPLAPGQTTPSPVDDRPHEYLVFEAGLPPRRLELNSSFGSVILPNIPPIRSLYNQYGGFAQAIVKADFIDPEQPDERVAWWKAQCVASGVNEKERTISLELATPVDLLSGQLLGRVFSEEAVPNLVIRQSVSLG